MAANLPIEQVMGNLKIDPYMNPKQGQIKDGNGSPSDATSCISSTGDASNSVKEGEVDYEPSTIPYSPTNYSAYYYPGFDGYPGGVDNQGYYVGGDGLEVQYPAAMVADNGSLVYFMPGYQPSYDPYTSYLPMATLGVDGQYIGQPPSPLSPMLSPSFASPGYYPTHMPYGSDLVSPSYVWNPPYMVGDGVYASGYSTTNVSDTSSYKPNLSTSGSTRGPSKPSSEFKHAVDNKRGTPVLDVLSDSGARSQLKGANKPTQNGVTVKPDSNQSKSNFPISKLSSNHHGKNGLLNQKNLHSKTDNTKNTLVTTEDTSSTSLVKRELYNSPDFPIKYSHAYFFVIKSYSEDDIHKSIKYNVWASTPNGNKRLDNAYQEAQGKAAKCPVFLFFSVNASGQFCGVAEMLGRVDFNKSMGFWQQDKWNGFFPVKWHIIKDVPNPQLRHIILENNENKPVTNSRDTQEVRFPQGIEMLSIFKNYVSKTSILDDFEFYESRQKVMQDKRIRPSTFRVDVAQQKADELSRVPQVTTNASNFKNVEEIRVGDKSTD